MSDKKLLIQSSLDVIPLNFTVDFIATIENTDYRRDVVEGNWSITPNNDSITIQNQSIILKDIDLTISEITVHFESLDKQYSASKTLKISNDVYKGKLVHYIRNDKQYIGNDYAWELWTHEVGAESSLVHLSFMTDFGISGLVQNQNVIARKKTWGHFWTNDWAEQTISFKLDDTHNNFYIIDGDDTIYTSLNDVVTRTNPRILFAVMDTPNTILAYLSHPARSDTVFDIYINDTLQEQVQLHTDGTSLKFSLQSNQIIGNDFVEIRASNTFVRYKVLFRNILDNFYYSLPDMGVIFDSISIRLCLFAPTAIKTEVLIYDKWDDGQEKYTYNQLLNYDPVSGTYSGLLTRNKYEYKYYLYRLYFNEIDQDGNSYTKITYAVDPYATAIAVNSSRGMLVDLNSPELTPPGWLKDKRPVLKKIEDAILYEMHIRDFTINNSSGVKEHTHGKFIAASETGCSYIDNTTGLRVMTGIDSLVELGITHVHLLPIADFASVDESKIESTERNWGYDPEHFNCPEGSYSTNPFDPISRIKELRKMIHGFHKNGIRVVMDVVYNHMISTISLDKIVPGYYFRSNYIGKFTNGSGCGNELATERPMVRKFVVDSIKHWVRNYRIDGIRFDLMELIDLTTIKEVVQQVKMVDHNFLVYGEPWRGGDTPLTNGTYRGTQRDQGFSIFNDVFRDAIRGTNYPSNGFINGGQHSNEFTNIVIEGLKGSIYSLTSNAIESINYVDAHDNYTLWDQIEKSQNATLKNGEYQKNIDSNIFDNHLVRQNSLAMGIILTSLGIPFLHGGVELLRTKQGDHNSYKSDDLINGFNWQNKIKFKPFFDYIKGLINIRKHHPAFRMNDRVMIENHLHIYSAYDDGTSGVIICHYKNNANHDKFKDIVVIYNATSIENYDVNNMLPKSSSNKWDLIVNHEKAGLEIIASYADGRVPALKSHSMMIIHS